jgi:hypothetical protein
MIFNQSWWSPSAALRSAPWNGPDRQSHFSESKFMKTLTYKGISILPTDNSEDEKFEAEIILKDGSTAFVNGASVEELKRQFNESVDIMESMGHKLKQTGRFRRALAEKLLSA